MKKLLAVLFIFGSLALGSHVHAAWVSDAVLRQMVSLRSHLGAMVLPMDNTDQTSGSYYQVSDTPTTTTPAVVAQITPTSDLTPRISYWAGKVNQHVSVSEKMWQTDSDGSSGANLDKLAYCQKWYPNTVSVVEYQNEFINSWHAAGNVGDYPGTKMTYKCVEKATNLTLPITVLSPNGGEIFTQGISNKISWTGGKNKVQVGLFSYNGGLIGYVELNGIPNSSTTWNGLTVKVLDGSTITNVKPGEYRIVAISESVVGNYCINDDQSVCNSDLSDNTFTIKAAPTTVDTTPVLKSVISTPTTDLTPRISYWYGKVNQHVDINSGVWMTDKDGTSGADLDKLSYCKKFYPDTTSVSEYKNETLNSWYTAGNTDNYSSTKMSYKCNNEIKVLPTTNVDTGCSAVGTMYSILTGKPCSTIKPNNEIKVLPTTNVDTGCRVVGSKFNILTGQPCSTITPTTDKGCVGAIGAMFSTLTGKPCSTIKPADTGCRVVGSKFNILTGQPCSTITPTTDKGCVGAIGAMFSTLTGKPCSTIKPNNEIKVLPTTNVDTGCSAVGTMFNILTGQPCSTITPTEDTGCSSGNVYSTTTGAYCIINSRDLSSLKNNSNTKDILN